MTKDVILDLGVQDGGSLKAVAEQVKQLDNQILATVRHIEDLNRKLSGLGRGARASEARESSEAELKALNKKLSDLLRDQATTRRAGKSSADAIYNGLQDPAQKAAVKLQLEAFKKSLDQQLSTQKDVLSQMTQKFQQELLRQRRQIETEIRNSQKEAAGRQRQSRIGQISSDKQYPEQYLRGLPAFEVQATRAAAAQMLKKNSDLGNQMGMRAASAALETIDKFMADKAAPGLRRRQEQLAAAVGNKAALNALIAGSNSEDLKALLKTAKKTASTEALQGGNSVRARDYAQLANALQNSLQQMAPAVQQLKQFAAQASTKTGQKQLLSSLQKEDPSYLRAQQTALNRQSRLAFNGGDKSEGKKFAKSAELVGRVLQDISNPSTGRLSELSRISGLKSDKSFETQLDALVRGKSISALEQLKVDTNALYKSDRATQGESERLRLVLDRLSRALDELQPKSGGKAGTSTPTQTQAQLLNQRLGTYSSARYDGRYVPDAGRLKGLGLTELENFQRGATERLRAQQLRVDQATATNGNVKAEVDSLNLLKEQLRTLEQQLTIKRQLANTTAKQNDPAYRQAQQEKAAQQAAERDSYAANRSRVLSQINQNQIRREVDGGADMFRNQALLLRNYAVLGGGVAAGYSTGSFIVELDKNFAQLQAILALTYNDMEKVKGSLIEISELTKFDAVEVVDTAVTLGQAGLSKDQILEALPGITLFATAVGTDLKSAVDLATSAMGVFNFEASRMPEIVDKLTISINQSKLNLDKVSLGLQYAGNIAEQSNVSFEDTVAALAAMANSGVKSGSTLGTGLRQILITLQKPTEGFKKKIFDLGLTMEDLDLRTYSLTDVMAKLSSSGFTVVDAMETMEVRAANAYGAFANNIQTARDITEAMNKSGAAAGANAIQMGALSNQWARFTSISKSVFYDALAPLVEVMTNLVKTTADWVSELKNAGPLLSGIMAFGVTRMAMGSVLGVGRLAGRLIGGRGETSGASEAVGGVSATGAAATIAATAMLSSTATTSAVLGVVRTVLGGPWIWGLSGVAALASYAYNSNNKSARLQQPLDMAKFESNQIQARLDRYSAGTKSVDSIISDAYYKRSALENPDQNNGMMRQFVQQINSELKNLGFYMEETAPAFDTLIGKLEELRGRMISFTEIDLARQADAARNEAKAQFGLLAGYTPTSKSASGSANPIARATARVVSSFNPDISKFLSTSSDGRSFDTTTSAFIQLLQSGKNLNINSPRSEISELDVTLKKRLQDLIVLTQTLDGQPESLKARAKENYVKPETVLAELEAAKADIQSQIELLDAIQTQLGKADKLPQQQQIVAIVEAVKKTFGAKANSFVESVSERNGQIARQYGKDSLGLYRGLSSYRSESEADAKGINQEIKAFVQAELIKSKLPAEMLNKVLTESRFPEFINGALAKTRSAQSTAAPGALRSLKRQNRAENGSIESELELRELELSDANSLKDIDRIEKAIEVLLRRQSELQLEISKAEAGEDLVQLEQIEISAREALENRVGSNAENAQRQRARLRASALFANGEFGAAGSSRVYSKEIGRAADQYFDKTGANESALLKSQLATAQAEKNRAEELKRQADKLAGDANDTGLGSEGQKQAYLIAIPLIERASRTAVLAMQREMSAYQADNRMKQERVGQLTSALPNVSPEIARRYQEEINKLTPTIEDNNKKIQELQGAIDKNTFETGQQTDAMRGNAALMEIQGKRFLSEDRRRVGAIIKGGSYQTDKQIAAGNGASTLAQTASGGYLTQVGNGFEYALEQSSKAYEGMEGLTEATLGFKEILDGAGGSLANFFTQFANGSLTAGESFRGFAASILQSLTEVSMQIAANALMRQVIGFAMNYFSAGTGADMAGSPNMNMGVQTAWTGGLVGAPRRHSSGGLITGGVQTRDSTLVNAAQGEFVLRRAAVQALGIDTVETLNNMDRSSVKSLENIPSGERQAMVAKESVVNVWVVSETEKPSSMDEGSVLVVVDKALMRNSSTRKLVKRISTGDM